LSVFINLRSAECVCSYYGLRVCSQTNKLKIKLNGSTMNNFTTVQELSRTPEDTHGQQNVFKGSRT